MTKAVNIRPHLEDGLHIHPLYCSWSKRLKQLLVLGRHRHVRGLSKPIVDAQVH